MDWLRYKKYYFFFSFLMLTLSVFSLAKWRLNLGVDFVGGSILEYKFEEAIPTEEATKKIKEAGIQINAIQTTSENTYLFRLETLDKEKKEKLNETFNTPLFKGKTDELRFENVGPSVGLELIRKTAFAILIASLTILLWVAYQFNSIKFGASAILAMFHDSFILVGSFSLLGHFVSAEVDFLFVTALLTTLSFSVHDTIVVFDRIREISGGRADLKIVSNRALTETMVRSLNNSFTIIFMLAALLLLGGTTVRWFAAALLIGTLLGTYSSPFVAVPLLVSWDGFWKRISQIQLKKPF